MKKTPCCIYKPARKPCVACYHCGKVLPGCRQRPPFPLRCNTLECQTGDHLPAFVNGISRRRVWGPTTLLDPALVQYHSALWERAYIDEMEYATGELFVRHFTHPGERDISMPYLPTPPPESPGITTQNAAASVIQWLGTNVGRYFITDQVPKRFALYEKLYGRPRA